MTANKISLIFKRGKTVVTLNDYKSKVRQIIINIVLIELLLIALYIKVLKF